jgi:hypothetical protein
MTGRKLPKPQSELISQLDKSPRLMEQDVLNSDAVSISNRTSTECIFCLV